jgi:electron transfer flavoprotein alpha subunit
MACKTLILAEHDGGALKEITWELLGMAHRLAGEAGWDAASIKAVILGEGVEQLASEIAGRGAAEVIYSDGPAFANYSSDAYDRAIEAIAKEESPDLILIGHTPNGWDVAPLVAAGLGAPLATDCSAVNMPDGKPRFTRKVFNGKFVQVVDAGGAGPCVATLQRGAAPAHEGSSQGKVRKVAPVVAVDDLQARFVAIKKGEAGAVDLTQASIIVSGGRGVGSQEKFAVIKELAEALGGQVGASRPVTDVGWLPPEHQIGSSGVTVNPKLYIACGISGAIQHIVGMRGSGYIVAINKDGDAPIFGVADIGVVGDLFEIVPALTKAAREARR